MSGARAKYANQYYEYDVTGKVKAIYSAEGYNEEDKQVEYKYDDRGFRIAKVDVPTGKTTWYVRDASGNIVSIYEDKNDKIDQIELPIYGATKLGTAFRDYHKYKYNYEITDHLGNVRSVVSKLKFMETATMETEHNFREKTIFANINPDGIDTRQQDQAFNHTTWPGSSWSSMLNGAGNRVIGPALSRDVEEGDKIKLDVYARFVEETDDGLIPAMIGFLASTYGVSGGAGGESTQIYDGLESAASLLSGLITNEPDAPRAYLMCMVFDENFTLITPEAGNYTAMKMMPATAASGYENLYLEIDIPENGKYIYTYVANESIGTKVFFDDFTVSQLGVDITQTTDYYPFGSIMSHWSKENYRFGYQGEFSEEDEETGFNHFEAREYDGKIGRWMRPDPARQHYSPYLAMGNNPVNRVDPNGESDRNKDGVVTVDGGDCQCSRYYEGRNEYVTYNAQELEGGAEISLQQYEFNLGLYNTAESILGFYKPIVENGSIIFTSIENALIIGFTDNDYPDVRPLVFKKGEWLPTRRLEGLKVNPTRKESLRVISNQTEVMTDIVLRGAGKIQNNVFISQVRDKAISEGVKYIVGQSLPSSTPTYKVVKGIELIYKK